MSIQHFKKFQEVSDGSDTEYNHQLTDVKEAVISPQESHHTAVQQQPHLVIVQQHSHTVPQTQHPVIIKQANTNYIRTHGQQVVIMVVFYLGIYLVQQFLAD